MAITIAIDHQVEKLFNTGRNLETIQDYILGYLSASHYSDGYHRLLLDLNLNAFIIEHATQIKDFSVTYNNVIVIDEFSSKDQKPFQRSNINHDNMCNFGSLDFMEAIHDEVLDLLIPSLPFQGLCNLK